MSNAVKKSRKDADGEFMTEKNYETVYFKMLGRALL